MQLRMSLQGRELNLDLKKVLILPGGFSLIMATLSFMFLRMRKETSIK